MVPYLGVVALACLLVVVEPDLGTAMVACFAAGGDADRRRGADAPTSACSPLVIGVVVAARGR